MRKTFARSVLLAALLLAPHTTFGQSEGLYVSGAIGFSQPRDSDVSGTGINSTIDSDLGLGLAGALGYAYGNNWRAEAEVNYRRSDVDSVSGATGSGDISALGLMVNGYYDFATGSDWTPYIGAGLGGASVSYDGVSPVGGSRIDDDDRVFAYQGIAGINYGLTEQAGIFAEYRYFGTADLGLRTDSGVGVDAEYGEHRIMFGLKWSFAAPPPPPPAPKPVVKPVAQPAPPPPPKPKPAPAPAPDVVRSYLVFFDWDRSDLTADARAIILEAARNSRKIAVTRIEATGHADRSGPDRYNMGLSQRRAQAVATELVRQGVSPDELLIRWKGERDPLVTTPDGVREPQNRRVEILFN